MGKPTMLIESWDKTGNIKVIVRQEGKEDKKYNYHNMNEYQLRKFKKLIKLGSVGKCFQFLKAFRIEDYK